MPSNNFNVGRDYQVVVLHPLAPGGRLDLQVVTSVDVKPNPKTITVNGLDGVDRVALIPGMYTGTIQLERGNSVVDDFQAAIDAAYYAGVNIPAGTVYIYINEVNGNQSCYQHDSAVIHATDLGTAKSDAAVQQTIMFQAAKRRKVS